jgi:hypothetical protein
VLAVSLLLVLVALQVLMLRQQRLQQQLRMIHL